MSRKAVNLSCTEKEKQQLEKWANGAKVEKRLNQRARIVLACLDKKTNLQVAKAARHQQIHCSEVEESFFS